MVTANKFDLKEKSFYFKGIEEADHQYCVSAKSFYNFDKPFLWLTRKLQNNPNLEFIAGPAIIPSQIIIDDALAEALRQDQLQAQGRKFIKRRYNK